jgi:hypothetical protein
MDDIPPYHPIDVDDLETAIREGRHLHPARAYRIKVADETLNFRPIEVVDPMPLGRQILEAAGAEPIDEFSIFALLPHGDFEDLRLEEPFDLRGRGTEKFICFRTDRLFKFTIDNRQMEWGKPLISGLIVRLLAAVGPEYAIYLEVRGGQDREIQDLDIIDLSKPGIERFITVIRETTEGLTALPAMDRAYLEDHAVAYDLVSEGGAGWRHSQERSVACGKIRPRAGEPADPSPQRISRRLSRHVLHPPLAPVDRGGALSDPRGCPPHVWRQAMAALVTAFGGVAPGYRRPSHHDHPRPPRH